MLCQHSSALSISSSPEEVINFKHLQHSGILLCGREPVVKERQAFSVQKQYPRLHGDGGSIENEEVEVLGEDRGLEGENRGNSPQKRVIGLSWRKVESEMPVRRECLP